MKVEFKASFAKDLSKIKDSRLKKEIGEVINLVEQAHSLREIVDLKKIVGTDYYYRIRMGDYRIGLVVEADVVIFVRFLHRKDVYRYFS